MSRVLDLEIEKFELDDDFRKGDGIWGELIDLFLYMRLWSWGILDIL
jgi:hypothetical protein